MHDRSSQADERPGTLVAARSWRVWSTSASVLVTDPHALDGAVRTAERWLSAVGDACDRFRSDSELSGIANASTGASVSPLLAELLDVALSAAEMSGGAVDPTVGAALVASGYDRDIELVLRDGVPTRAVVTPVPGWRRVRLADGVLTMPEGLRLDLGATAKAFAADRIAAAVLAESGVGVLVNLGGDIATAGPGPVGGWQITVQDVDGDPATQVSLAAGSSLATSSTQRRRWSADGHIRHHIVDPVTGLPATPVWRTVSVVAPTAVLANTCSTMAVVLGADATAVLAEAGLPARLVAADGSVRVLGGWPADRVPEAA